MLDKLKAKMAEKIEKTREIMELPAAPESVRAERLAICRSCEELRASEFCKMCNCYMPAKVFIAGVSCPAKKWLAVQSAKN
jgi:recombinational DNA repair protein RecR